MTLEGGTWSEVQLATTEGQTLSLVDIGSELTSALLASQVFIVATRTDDGNGNTLFDFAGGLGMAGWTFGVTLASPGQVAILKFAGDTIESLAGKLGSWALPSLFNADANATQAAVVATIADGIAKATSGTPAEQQLYADFATAVTDPAWNGVLILAPQLPGLPPMVRGLASGLPVGQSLIGHSLGVRINDIGQSGLDPSLQASATFAIVDYQLPPPSNAATTPTADYLFNVELLLAGFQNAQLRQFDAEIQLVINTLFGVPAVLQTIDNSGKIVDAALNAIEIHGAYQARPDASGGDDQGIYSFVTVTPAAFRLAYEQLTSQVQAHVLASVTFDKIQYAPLSSDGTAVRSRFALWGTLAFVAPGSPGALTGPDLFDFDALPFANLGLVMASHVPPVPGDPTWSFDVSAAAFDLSNAALRAGLVQDLPVKLQRLAYDSNGGLTPASLGCVPFVLPSTAMPQAASAQFALVYQIDLGQPGAYAPASRSLIATVAIGWSPSGTYFAALGIPGLGPQNQLPLQGIIPLSVSSFALALVPPKAVEQHLAIELTGCSVSFLGASVPSLPQTFDIALFGKPPYPSSSILWFATTGGAT